MSARRTLLALAVLAAVAPLAPASAHPHEPQRAQPAPPHAGQFGQIEQQVLDARRAMQAAITARDAARLRALYAPSFTHTHGSGRVDGRDARIVQVIAGEPVIEMARVDELSIRIPHPDTAIVTGKSPILNRAENRDYDFRWIQVWVRVGGEWQIVASQATRLPAPAS